MKRPRKLKDLCAIQDEIARIGGELSRLTPSPSGGWGLTLKRLEKRVARIYQALTDITGVI